VFVAPSDRTRSTHPGCVHIRHSIVTSLSLFIHSTPPGTVLPITAPPHLASPHHRCYLTFPGPFPSFSTPFPSPRLSGAEQPGQRESVVVFTLSLKLTLPTSSRHPPLTGSAWLGLFPSPKSLERPHFGGICPPLPEAPPGIQGWHRQRGGTWLSLSPICTHTEAGGTREEPT